MSEPNSRTSHHILSFLEGEKLRVIFYDGSVLEGKVSQVSTDAIRLGDTDISINEIATYFVLQES